MLDDKDRIFTNVYGFQDVGPRRRRSSAVTGTIPGRPDGARARRDHRGDQGLGLRGRGGAGFPTGMKWSFMPKESTRRAAELPA